MTATSVAAVVFSLAVFADVVSPHGRLVDPPSRSSMWRYGFNTPRNYNDMALFCGGKDVQWIQNNGKCGICGDPWNGPRDNEAGGKYATGTISRHYKVGQVIDVDVELTANHLGYFEFKLCPNNNPLRAASPECLDRYVLRLADGSGTQYRIGRQRGHIRMKYRLPAGLTCTQCIFQWRYHTGNSWGTGKNCIGLGCGQMQEEFYGCADVEISGYGQRTTVIPTHPPTQRICWGIGTWKGVGYLNTWCKRQCNAGYCPLVFCKCSS